MITITLFEGDEGYFLTPVLCAAGVWLDLLKFIGQILFMITIDYLQRLCGSLSPDCVPSVMSF